MDSVGAEGSRPESDDEKRAKRILETTTIRLSSNRFETGLLWRHDEFKFPKSYEMALRRLQCLERRLKKDENLYGNVCKQIDDYQHKGYAHKASSSE